MEHKDLSLYRPNVCAAIYDQFGERLLFCHRINFQLTEGWQFPQGGYDPELDLIEEMKRELREEITSDAIEVLKISDKEYFYDFPPHTRKRFENKYIGQRQKWVLAQLVGGENAINVNTDIPEFDNWIWVKPEEAIIKVVDFKREIYKEALHDLGVL